MISHQALHPPLSPMKWSYIEHNVLLPHLYRWAQDTWDGVYYLTLLGNKGFLIFLAPVSTFMF